MHIMQQFIHKELSYFRNLNKEGQQMLASISLYNIIDPIIWTFVVAFLWRLSNNTTLIASYYIAIFTGLIIGFYYNGKLLNRFSPARMYLVGCITQACVMAILVIFSFTNYFIIMSMGILFGVAAGFFWANRNFLTLRVTETDQRIYFTSLETTGGIITNLIIPALAGSFIVFGSHIHLYTTHTAYEILALIAIITMTYTGLLAKHIHLNVPPIKQVTLHKTSNTWQRLRLFSYITGIFSGIDIVLPTILILTFVGNEGSLGILQSISSVLSACVLYYVGKKANNTHRLFIFGVSVFFAIIGWGFFGITYSALGVIVYMACIALGDPFRWISINPIIYDVTDHEQERGNGHHYSYVFDQELFLNLGRISALIIFIVLFTYIKIIALRISPFFFASSQILLLWLVASLEKVLQTYTKPTLVPAPAIIDKEGELNATSLQ